MQEGLTNVLRHSTARQARVRIGQDEGALLIEVLDEGRPRPSAAHGGGHGLLGMRERAAALGGSCEAGRAPGGGWRVRARIPIERAGSLTELIRVLVADDHSLVRAGFHSMLSNESDIDVVGEARDGAEAVALARDEAPDVVLMDIRMPELDGLEATRLITSDPRLRRTSVVVAHHVRPGRVRLRGAPGGSERVPAQGSRTGRC